MVERADSSGTGDTSGREGAMPEGQMSLTHRTIVLWALKIRKVVSRLLNWKAEETKQVQRCKQLWLMLL